MDPKQRPGGRPAAATPGGDADDPWARLARENQAASSGRDAREADLGDTGRWLRRDNPEAELLEGPGPSTEILQLISTSLAAEPDRPDLWMMRFDVQKTLGLKQEFADAMVAGMQQPRVARQLDWSAVRALWDELAPGEPLPGGLKLPEARRAAGPDPARPGTITTPAHVPRTRRFADIAQQVAARELAVFAKAYAALQARPGFFEESVRKIAPMLGRPTPLQFAEALSQSGARVFLKREDQRRVTPEEEAATVQAHLASVLGRPMIVTANDVDAHALAVATVAPKFGLQCSIVVRSGDHAAKAPLLAQLRERGAQIETMPEHGMLGTDPREGALRLWQRSLGRAFLALSLGTGPYPYPALFNHFQSLLGRETDLQLRALKLDGRPRTLVAAVQSEGDSIGFVLPFLQRNDVEIVYAEPEPGGLASWRPSARLRAYNGAIREHAWLRGLNRIEHVPIGDDLAWTARQNLEAVAGIRVSLEDARAIALTRLLVQRGSSLRDFVVLVA